MRNKDAFPAREVLARINAVAAAELKFLIAMSEDEGSHEAATSLNSIAQTKRLEMAVAWMREVQEYGDFPLLDLNNPAWTVLSLPYREFHFQTVVHYMDGEDVDWDQVIDDLRLFVLMSQCGWPDDKAEEAFRREVNGFLYPPEPTPAEVAAGWVAHYLDLFEDTESAEGLNAAREAAEALRPEYEQAQAILATARESSVLYFLQARAEDIARFWL
jgi:hypothetical protein